MKLLAIALGAIAASAPAFADLPPGALVRIFTSDASLAAFKSARPDLRFVDDTAVSDASGNEYSLVMPDAGVPFTVHAATCTQDGKVAKGAELARSVYDGKTVLVIRAAVREGCPGAMVCMNGGRDCWSPGFSGKTGMMHTTRVFRDWDSMDPAARFGALVTDRDPKGTNVRETPGGRIADVIPYPGKNPSDEALERRIVRIAGQSGNWFAVSYNRSRFGWLHRSVIGLCSSGTEDGPARLYQKPDDAAGDGKKIPSLTELVPLAVSKDWMKVSLKLPDGSTQTGWMHVNTTFANPYTPCPRF